MAKMQELVTKYSDFAQRPTSQTPRPSKRTIVSPLHAVHLPALTLRRSSPVLQDPSAPTSSTNCSTSPTSRASSASFVLGTTTTHASELRRAFRCGAYDLLQNVREKSRRTRPTCLWLICK